MDDEFGRYSYVGRLSAPCARVSCSKCYRTAFESVFRRVDSIHWPTGSLRHNSGVMCEAMLRIEANGWNLSCDEGEETGWIVVISAIFGTPLRVI